MRYSHNNLKTIGEVGNTSSWVVAFDNIAGSSAPDANNFNLIKNEFSPVLNVDYEYNIISRDVTVGPDLLLSRVVRRELPKTVKVTFLDTMDKMIRTTLRDWCDWGIKAPSLKNIQMAVHIHHFDNNGDQTMRADKFLIVPDGSLDFSGNQDFSADTFSVTFKVIGEQ